MENSLLRELSSVPELFATGFFYKTDRTLSWTQYYRPLTSVTFALDYSFWKLNPLGYNLTNLALHCGIALLLLRLLFRATGNVGAAFVAALAFAVNTIHTESVTYIASRGDLLGAAFTLSALLLYWRGERTGALAAYAISLFAKESCILLPLYVIVLDVAFVRSSFKDLVRRLVPYAAVGAAFLLFRKFGCAVPLAPPVTDAKGAALRLLSMGDPYLRYVRALLFPEPFKYCDSIAFVKTFADPRVAATLAVVGSYLTLWIMALRRRGAAFFGLTLAALSFGPYLQIVPFYPQWAEHYFLFPSIGFAFVLAAGLARALAAPRACAIAAFAAAFAFSSFFALRTYQRNTFYSDNERFYDTLSKSDTPYAYYGHLNLGRIYFQNGDLGKAAVYFRTALAIDPTSEVNQFNMGAYFLKTKRYADAYPYFKKAYALDGPDSAALTNAGVALMGMGRYADAAGAFEAAWRMQPEELRLYVNLLLAYELDGKLDLGLRWTDEGLRAFEGKPKLRSILRAARSLSLYRDGRDTETRQELEVLLAEGGEGWYGDMARAMLGRMPAGDYETLVRTRYPAYEKEALGYALAARVLAGDGSGAATLLSARRLILESSEKDPKLLEKEIARVERAASL